MLWPLLLICIGESSIVPKITLSLPAYEESLEWPRALVRGEKNRFYLLDGGLRALFVWDREGRFEKRIGRKGQGPGEFEFPWPGFAYMGFDGEYIFVVDGGTSKVHWFLDGEFVETKSFHFPGRITGFHAMKGGKCLVMHENHRDQTKVVLYEDARDWRPIKTMIAYPEKKWSRKEDGGWVMHAFLPQATFYGEAGSNQFLLGYTESPVFCKYNTDGNKLGCIRFQGLSREVLPEDKRGFSRAPWFEDPKNQLAFPDQHPAYDGLAPIRGNRFIIWRHLPWTGRIESHIIDERGERLAAFNLSLGERGGLDALEGWLVVVDASEDIKITLCDILPAGDEPIQKP